MGKNKEQNKTKQKEQNIRCGIPYPATLIITVGNQTRKFNEPEWQRNFLIIWRKETSVIL